tara:strand:- start:7426 stop:8046 length:621 start_codon:yes stop_codon:yes gene_type:complete
MSGDPVTMLLIAKGVETAMSGIAANKAGKANQMIANANAAIQRQQAEAARAKSDFDANEIRRKGLKITSQGRTSYAKGGVEIAGTPVEVLGQIAADVEFDAQTQLYDGELAANNYLSQASMSEYEGRIARQRGKSQQTSAFVGAGVSLIGAGFTSGAIPPVSNPFASTLSSRATSPSGYYPSLAGPQYTTPAFASGSYTANPNIFR